MVGPKYVLVSLTNVQYRADGGDPDARRPRTDARGDRRAADDGGGGVAARRSGAAATRTVGDGQGRGVGAGPDGHCALERAEAGDSAPLVGGVSRRGPRRRGRCTPSGTPPEGRCPLSRRAGDGGGDVAPVPGIAV